MRRDVALDVRFDDEEAVRRYVGSSAQGASFADNVPKLEEPLVARKLISVFVATNARAGHGGGEVR